MQYQAENLLEDLSNLSVEISLKHSCWTESSLKTTWCPACPHLDNKSWSSVQESLSVLPRRFTALVRALALGKLLGHIDCLSIHGVPFNNSFEKIWFAQKFFQRMIGSPFLGKEMLVTNGIQAFLGCLWCPISC